MAAASNVSAGSGACAKAALRQQRVIAIFLNILVP